MQFLVSDSESFLAFNMTSMYTNINNELGIDELKIIKLMIHHYYFYCSRIFHIFCCRSRPLKSPRLLGLWVIICFICCCCCCFLCLAILTANCTLRCWPKLIKVNPSEFEKWTKLFCTVVSLLCFSQPTHGSINHI